MNIGFSIFFAVGALMPGFFLFHFFKDALDTYKTHGKYFWSTLLDAPGIFFLSLAAFLILAGLSLWSLL